MHSEKQIEDAFIRSIQQHQGILHKICFLYSSSKEDKEDLYQEIILQLWKSYPSFEHKSKFSTWMYRVALNTAISMTKKASLFQNRRSLVHADLVESPPDYSEDVQRLYKAIAKLKKVEKAIILLWLEEKPYQEIAEIVGLSEKNVSVKLVRIKKKLAKIMSMQS